jgi:hypothetical protein
MHCDCFMEWFALPDRKLINFAMCSTLVLVEVHPQLEEFNVLVWSRYILSWGKVECTISIEAYHQTLLNSSFFGKYADFTLSSIKHSPSSSWRTCWGILERGCSFENNHSSRYPFSCNVHYFLFFLNVSSLFFFTLPLGFHLKLPWLTHYEAIQVTLQTDQASEFCSLHFVLLSFFAPLKL